MMDLRGGLLALPRLFVINATGRLKSVDGFRTGVFLRWRGRREGHFFWNPYFSREIRRWVKNTRIRENGEEMNDNY
jgi:hypothetical protein